MSDTVMNAQLDLACRVGSREAIEEALQEGADINHSGSSPLILSIMARDRATIATLVELGADVSCFALKATDREAIVDALLQCAPSQAEATEEDPVDAKLVRAFDKMIRTKGIGEPFKKRRGSEFPVFCESLKWIAAEDCQSIVTEFLEPLEPLRAKDGDLGVDNYLAENPEKLEELTARYGAVPDLPGDLLKEYLKERKKLAKAK